MHRSTTTTTGTARVALPRTAAALAVLLLLVPAVAATATPLADEPVGSLARPGDGRATCGLGQDFHAGRRALLRERLGRGLVLVRGLPETRDYTEFRQDKVFWYLTGIESPNASLLMDCTTGLEVLFLPERDARAEAWDGELWDAEDEWVPELTGFSTVRATSELGSMLDELAAGRETIWISYHPWVALAGGYDRAIPRDRAVKNDPFDGRPPREDVLGARLAERTGLEVEDLSPALHRMRWVKTPEEIAALRRSGLAGARAMSEAIRSTRPGLGEWEIDALLRFVQELEGADGPAYHAIVGSGPNSCVLHYSASARRMHAGEVLLVDAGGELDHYTTDITRTWPVGGRFTERQAELYDAVLAAQEAAIAAVRPGITLADVERAAREVLVEHGLGGLLRHGACHWIGLEVHDVGDYGRPLEPGVAFTVEPGVYEEEAGIGIRIEDVVVVTEDGCKILTRAVPVAREEIEALVAEPGLLDRIAAGDG